MFEQLKNIDSAFKHVRLLSFAVIVASAFLCCYTVYKSYVLVSQMQSRIYVLFNGKVLEAFASERNENIPVEAKDHIATFHYLFFTLDPDDKMIQANIKKALYLADESAKRQYDNLKESRFYSNLISGNISQKIVSDSIHFETNSYPYYFRYYARQEIIRSTTIVYRTLITEGYLRNVARSENNSHGFMIERWNTLENHDINTLNR